jgi:hypothetical protein
MGIFDARCQQYSTHYPPAGFAAMSPVLRHDSGR